MDDDRDIRELISTYLGQNDYEIDEAENGEEAMILINEKSYDLVILDIMMPKKNGYEVVKEIRETSIVPVIFLTAKDDEVSMIKGFNLGADDYISKPFSSMELMVRVKCQLRRYKEFGNNSTIITIDELWIDTEKYKVMIGNNEINLTPTEYKILLLFCKNQGTVFTLEQIYKNIWDDKYAISNAAILVHITKLRQKLEKNPKSPQYIKTVWGVGYKI